MSVLRRSPLRCLKVFQHLFKIVLDNPFALPGLIEVATPDELLVLPYLVGNPVLPNRARRLTKLVAGLLAILTHSPRRLIDVAFEPCDLIRKRLFAFADLLFLLVACASGLSLARKFIHAAGDLFLTFYCFFCLLPKLLDTLLATRALR